MIDRFDAVFFSSFSSSSLMMMKSFSQHLYIKIYILFFSFINIINYNDIDKKYILRKRIFWSSISFCVRHRCRRRRNHLFMLYFIWLDIYFFSLLDITICRGGFWNSFFLDSFFQEFFSLNVFLFCFWLLDLNRWFVCFMCFSMKFLIHSDQFDCVCVWVDFVVNFQNKELNYNENT